MTFSIYEIILLATFICFVLFPKKENVLKGWGYFLVFAVLFEFFITFYWGKIVGNNYIPFNFFAIGCALYYIFISYNRIKKKKIAPLFLAISIIWAVTSCILFIYNLESRRTTNLLYVSGVLLAIVMILIYFKDIAESRDFRDITKMPYFYFSLGILIFFVCSFPLLVFFNQLMSNENVNKAFSDILKIGNICLYLGYLLTTLCSIRNLRFIGS